MDKLLTAKDIAKIEGRNIKTIYKFMKRPNFPKLPRQKNEQYLVTETAYKKWRNREEYSMKGGE